MSAGPELGASARRVAATVVEVLRTRLELGATELAEERAFWAQQVLTLSCALFCLGSGLVLGVLALAWWAGPAHAATVLGVSAALLWAAAAWGWLRWQRLARAKPALLGDTLALLRADAQALAPEKA